MHGTASNEHEQPQDSFPVSRCACPIALRTLTHKSSIKFAPAELRARSNSPACRDGFVGEWLYYRFLSRAFWIQKDEAHGVGIGTADDAALEEISRVHRLVSRRSWKGGSLLPPLLRERFELPLLCTPTGSVSTGGVLII
jgi:hypothetical protein